MAEYVEVEWIDDAIVLVPEGREVDVKLEELDRIVLEPIDVPGGNV